MALPRDLASGSAAAVNASRLSLASDAPSRNSTDYSAANTTRNGITVPPELLQKSAAAQARYPIHAVLADPKGTSSLLPTMPALPSASSYLPSQLSSLSTTFTSAGTLPRSATPAGKSVAQRRAQAPPIQVSELRKVPKTDFDAYLSEIREEYDRWQHEARIAAAEAEGAAAAQNGPATSRSASRDEVLPPLEDIPRIFFDSTFNLSNPRTFDLVTERIQFTPNASPNLSKLSAAFDEPTPKTDSGRNSFDHVPGLGPETLQDLAADQVLQDKLSHYTAVIESHLVREIGLRSSSFFAALSNLQALHQQGQDALGKIAELQGSLGTERGGVGSTAKHGLQILRAQARRRGLERIEESVRAVDEIWTAVEGVKELVENGEWDGALEVSEQIEAAYYASSSSATTSSSSSSRTANGEHRPSLSHAASSSGSLAATGSHRRPTPRRAVNLTKLRALASLPSKLALLRAQIAKSLEGELVTVLEHELDTGIDEHVKLAKSGRRWKGKEREKEPRSSLGQSSLAVVRENDAEEESDEAAPETKARERITDRVRPVVRALVRADGMDSAITAWRESVLREIRASVREHLPTAGTPGVEDDDSFAQAAIRSVSKQSVDLGSISEKSLSLAKKLRALSHAEFVALAQETYLGLLACIELVNLQAQVLVSEWQTNRREEAERRQRRRGAPAESASPNPISSSSSHLAVPNGPEPSPSTPEANNSLETRSTTSEDANTLANEITDVVHAVAELANVRFSKVIAVRTEVHAQLALADFVQIFDLSWDFVVQCERICQRMIVGLRGAMVAQAKTFLQAFHQRQITENARVVEEEQWAAVEVAPNVQASVACIIQIATSDPPELLLGSRSSASSTSSTASGSSPPGPESVEGPSAKTVAGPARQINIEGKQFFAVSAGLTTIVALMEYLKVLVNAPMLTTDVMSKIIEFMKVFNSRTCQVVLGAGAMRSAGLKNITAKHLALASQALSIMVSLIPYIREGVRRHLNPKQAVMLTEFDKLRRDYQEHQHEIHAKLIAIMSDRLHVHSRTLETINWEEPAPRPGAPNAYMEALVKEHTTLHKVLSRFLQPETVQHIMTQVFAALDAKLAELYGKVELKSQDAQDRMLVDVRYLASKLGGLKSVEDDGPGKTLETLVQSKDIPRPRTPAPAKPPSPAKIATPARSSSMQPPESPVPSAEPPEQAREEPATEKLATSQSQTASPRTSTDPASEADPSRRGAEPSSQNSVDVTGGESTASTADTPLTASSAASTASSSPTIPATTSRKRKTLAERLVERMGRKAVAHTAVPATPSNSDSASTAERELQEIKSSAPSEPSEKQADDASKSLNLPAPQEILQEGLDTPTLERTLALDVEGDAPLPTPTVEELDAAEREISIGQSAQPPLDPTPASPIASSDSKDVSEPIEATSSADPPAPADAGVEVEGSAAEESASQAIVAAAAESDAGAPVSAAGDAPLSNEDVPLVADDSAPSPTEETQLGGDRQHEEAIAPTKPPGADDMTVERPQSPPTRAGEMPAEEGDSTSAIAAESATIPQIQITSAVEDKVSGEGESSDHAAARDESAESREAPALSSQPAVSAIASPDLPPTMDLPSSSVSTVDVDRSEQASPEKAPPVENGADVLASREIPASAPSLAPEPSNRPAAEEPITQQDTPATAASTESATMSEPPEPVPPILTSPPISVVTTSPPPPTSPPATTSPATSPPPVNGARRKTLKERLAEAARARNPPSNSLFDDAKPSVTASDRPASKPDGHSESGKSSTPASETAAVAPSSSEPAAPPAATDGVTSNECSASTGDRKPAETSTGNTE